MKLSKKLAQEISERFVQLWNDSSIEDVLTMFADEIVHTSKMVKIITGDPCGTIRGKENLKEFFIQVRQQIPQHKFELVESHLFEGRIILFLKTERDSQGVVGILSLNNQWEIIRSEVCMGDIPILN